MNWISTQDFISMLKRFYDREIEVSLYLGNRLRSTHWWEYRREDELYWRSTDNGDSPYTEREVFRYFGNQLWKPKPFFFLGEDTSKRLAIRLVEELISNGQLDDVISQYDIDNVRECCHCHQLMEEGWAVEGVGQYCSDKCLKYAFPKLDIEEVNRHANEVGASVYWTEWED